MIKKKAKNRGTKTRAFGTSKRENHDSSVFYARKIYMNDNNVSDTHYIEQQIPDKLLDQLYCSDSRDLSIIPDDSVHLMVTSPPYNCGKDYDQNLNLNEYRELLFEVFEQVYSKLVQGGRACINIANLGRNPYIPLHSYIIKDLLEIGFLMRGEIIWNKAASAGSSTAWGSWMSASNPTLRDVHEYILVFSKGSMRRIKKGRESTITRDEFLKFTKSMWAFSTESAKKVGHPAPFPIELPYRLIQLYTFSGDVVLDPFLGSGTSCIAAMRTNRHYLGFDINEKYINLARSRIEKELNTYVLYPES